MGGGESMQRQNGAMLWNILFTRTVHDWEVKAVSRIFFFLRYCTLLKLEVRERIKCVGFWKEIL
jgi:ligand-binding sensor protein